MSQGNFTAIVGNAVGPPELRFTAGGAAVATFGVAVNRRWKAKGSDEWQEETSFFNVTCWGTLGENVAETIQKGTRVMVEGRLEQRTWETESGDKRSTIEIVADDVAPSLRWATATVVKNDRSDSATSRSSTSRPAPTATEYPDDEPF